MSTALGVADAEAISCFFPSMPHHIQVEDELKIIPVHVNSVSLLEAFVVGKEIAIQSVFLVAWSLVLREFVGTDFVRFGLSVPAKSESPICIQSYSININNSTEIQEICRHFDLLQAGNAESLQAPEPNHFNSCIIIVESDADDISNNFNVAPHHWGKDILPLFDIAILSSLSGDRRKVGLRYRSTWVSEEQAESIANIFQHAMESILHGSMKTVSQISLFSPRCRQLLQSWDRPPASRIDRCLHQIIEEQTRLRPNETAIHAWDGNLSYSELDCYSNKLACHLLSLGICSGEKVPLLIDKSRWAVVGVIGTMKTGAVCVPLDRGYPATRIENILKSVNADIVLTDETNSPRLNGKARIIVAISTQFLERLIDQQLPPQIIDPINTTAFILFTSGSTGTPKGIIRKHAANYTAVVDICKSYSLNCHSRSFQFGSLTFILSMNDMLATLLAGGCVCVPSEKDRVNDLNGSMKSLAVNHCALTPTVARLIDYTLISRLNSLVIGGEVATRDEITTWSSKSRLIIDYGSSEAGSSVRRFVTAENNDPSNIGGYAGLGLWIVNPTNPEKLKPIGAPGELLVEGNTLAVSYLNEKEKSREAFIKAPPWLSSFRNSTDDGLFKTGDIVRYHLNGSIIYLGRKDTQVKLRGQRIELEEVEYHVKDCLDYEADVIAQVIEPLGTKRNPALVVFLHFKDIHVSICDSVILNELCHLTGAVKTLNAMKERLVKIAANIRPMLESRLPQNMIPSFYVPLARIPLTASGKLHRKEVEEAASCIPVEDLLAFTTPENYHDCKFTEMQIQLKRLWAQVLGIQPSSISPSTSFFEMGGDSYVAIQMVALARKFQIGLQVADILRFPTLRDLATHAIFLGDQNHLSNVYQPFSALSEAPIDSFLHTVIFPRISFPMEDVVDVFPVTAHQATHLRKLSPRFGLYYQAMELGNKVDFEHIKSSCEKLVQHHEVLRALFVEFKGTFFQANLRKMSLPFAKHYVDGKIPDLLSICHHDRTEATLVDCFTKFIVVQQRASSVIWLVVRLSHAQFDAYCVPQLIQGLSAAILGEPLPQACGFSALVYYREEQKSRAYRYWSNFLHGSSVTVISDFSARCQEDRKTTQVAAQSTISLSVLPDGITFSTLICAAWAIVLSKLTGNTDVVFGRLVVGRSAALRDVDRICGLCCNVIPARIKFQPLWKAKDLLSTMQEQVISSIPYEILSWEEIISNSTNWQPGTSADTTIHNEASVQAHCLHLDDRDVYPAWILDEHDYQKNFTIYAYPGNPDRTISTRTDTSKFSQEAADSLVQRLANSMQYLVAHPEANIGAIMQNLP